MKRGRIPPSGNSRAQAVPAREAVARELGAKKGSEGEYLVEESELRKDGAINEDASLSNRRRAKVVQRKRDGERRIYWGEPNACLFYDDLVNIWPATSVLIMVQRMTGNPTSWYLRGHPRNGKELYEAVRVQCHGQSEEAEYAIFVRDAQSKFDRGKGRLHMPSTVDEVLTAAPTPPQYGPPPPPQVYPWAPPPTAMPPAQDPYVAQLLKANAELQAKLASLVPPPPAPPAAPPIQPGVALPTGQPGLYYVQGLGVVQLAAPPAPPAPAAAPPPPPNPNEALQGAFALARSSITMAQDMGKLVTPAQVVAQAPTSDPPATQLMDLGSFKIMQNTADGSLRPVETALANSDKIMGWIEKQQQKYQEHQRWMAERGYAAQSGAPPPEQQQQQQQQQQAQQMSSPSIPR